MHHRTMATFPTHHSDAVSSPHPAITLRQRVALKDGIATAVFDYDVLALDATITDGSSPEKATPNRQYLIFRQAHESSDPAVFRVSEATMAVLELVDGRRTMGNIADEIRRRFGTVEKLEVDVLNITNQLVHVGVLRSLN